MWINYPSRSVVASSSIRLAFSSLSCSWACCLPERIYQLRCLCWVRQSQFVSCVGIMNLLVDLAWIRLRNFGQSSGATVRWGLSKKTHLQIFQAVAASLGHCHNFAPCSHQLQMEHNFDFITIKELSCKPNSICDFILFPLQSYYYQKYWTCWLSSPSALVMLAYWKSSDWMPHRIVYFSIPLRLGFPYPS